MNLLNDFIKFFSLNKKYLFIIIILITLILLAIFIYKNYLKHYLIESYTPNKEYISSDSNESYADMYFFYTEWCPHCKTAKPIWENFKEMYKDKLINNKAKLNFLEIDCDKETETANKFNVEGYPTIKMIYSNKIIEYDAKPELDTLSEFVEESIK